MASFHELSIMKFVKILATGSQILRRQCTKFDFDWGSAPDPARGSLLTGPLNKNCYNYSLDTNEANYFMTQC